MPLVRPPRGGRRRRGPLHGGPQARPRGVPGGVGLTRQLLVAIFEPAPGTEAQADALLRAARERAEAAGWRCWAYRNELHPQEITLFIEGPRDDARPAAPVFGDEIGGLRALSRRFEPVRSLVELPLEDGPP